MNILLKSLAQVEKQFGKKATMATNLLDMVGQGERAFGFLTGTMDDGWSITIGIFNDKVRYACYKKRTASHWTEGDLRAVLMQIGPFSNWTHQAGSDYVDYAEKQGDTVVEATGWQSPSRTYAFVYVPVVEGDVGLTPDKNAVDQKAGN